MCVNLLGIVSEKASLSSPASSAAQRQLSGWGIFIGLVVGTLLGWLFKEWGESSQEVHQSLQWVLVHLIQPVGTVFLRSLYMVIVPLVAGSLLVGIVNLGTGALLRKLGWKLLFFYLTTTLCATLVGQTLINTVRPGEGLPDEVVAHAIESQKTQVEGLKEKSSWVGRSLWPGIVNKIIPKNILREYSDQNMLAIIFVSLLFGIALLGMKPGRAKEAFVGFFSILSETSIKIVGWIMKMAPYAVGALMTSTVASFGIEVIANNLVWFVLTVLGALLIQFVFVYGALLRLFLKVPLLKFYKKASIIFVTAFGTSSSAATMPVTIRTLEKEFGVPDSVTTFSVPLGVTINMDGTALFEVMAALFIAQVFGVELSLVQHITLVVLVMVTSIGVAGVPGGSLPVLIMAMSTLGIPVEGIGLILGVDRLLDMCRTVINVTGDSVAALFLARSEKMPLSVDAASPPSS